MAYVLSVEVPVDLPNSEHFVAKRPVGFKLCPWATSQQVPNSEKCVANESNVEHTFQWFYCDYGLPTWVIECARCECRVVHQLSNEKEKQTCHRSRLIKTGGGQYQVTLVLVWYPNMHPPVSAISYLPVHTNQHLLACLLA